MRRLLWIAYLPFPAMITISSCFSLMYFYFFILLYLVGYSAQIGKGTIITCISATFISIFGSQLLSFAIFKQNPILDIEILIGITAERLGAMYCEYGIRLLCIVSLFLGGLALMSIVFNQRIDASK